ncbi:surface lipoprotein assembly modifier [Candidatus Viadribacter manganicus]|uniref:DUF560 domain-containing protein n=1 Tax=Candidatus Viadribacter manganicus TaxID=1759059 RepID=A0A1B1AIT0_9PROT|nr:surface lipoprotein assembly modifier [Candidatus Viadribacter manganicus]ANP46462.1 hypothetical protein ATE48_11305 [Candidatus Viadribacter manganicus]
MGTRGKIAGFCRALLLVASVSMISISSSFAQDLGALSDRILDNPQDAELNFEYARAAEQQGHLRLALAAYERVMINDPSNEEARRGYERIRRLIEPPFTTLNTEFGVRWDSNALNSAVLEEDAYSYFARGTLIDERNLGGRHWRSIVNVEAETTPDIDELDRLYVGAQTGPLVYVGPHVAAIPSIGIGVATLNGDHFFNDYNIGVTVEGKSSGMSYWTRLRAGYREYADDAVADQGPYAELIGGLSVPRILSDSDTFVVIPWARWSDIEGTSFTFLGDLSPGQFLEYGAEATYNYQVNDKLILSAGGSLRQRNYTESTLFSGDDRADFLVSPEAAVTVQNFAPCECAVRLSYQYRDNDSNDPLFEYDGERVQLSLRSRF